MNDGGAPLIGDEDVFARLLVKRGIPKGMMRLLLGHKGNRMPENGALLQPCATSDLEGADCSGEIDTSLLALLEKSLHIEDSNRRRALKGALGQKAAAEKRHLEWESIARQIMASRRTPFASYRELACAVASRSKSPCSAETIRKRLAAARLLDG